MAGDKVSSAPFFVVQDYSQCSSSAAENPSQDNCTIEVRQKQGGNGSLVIAHIRRQGDIFKLAPNRQLPGLFPGQDSIPLQEMQSFIAVIRKLHYHFGSLTDVSPKSIVQEIAPELGGKENIFAILNHLANFIVYGKINTVENGHRVLLEHSIHNAIASFANPKFGKEVEKILADLLQNNQLDEASKNRARWFQGLLKFRKVLWEKMGPQFKQAGVQGNQEFEYELKASSRDVIKFLFSPHRHLARPNLFFNKQQAQTHNFEDASKEYHKAQKDSVQNIEDYDYTQDNYYSYMARLLKEVQSQLQLSGSYQAKFNKRLNFVINEFNKESEKEAEHLLAQESASTDPTWKEHAFKLSILRNYDHDVTRNLILKIILKHVHVTGEETLASLEKRIFGQENDPNKTVDAQEESPSDNAKKSKSTDPKAKASDKQLLVPTFTIDMAALDQELRDWVLGTHPSEEERGAAISQSLDLLKQLFERGKSMKAYWNGVESKMPNLFSATNIGKGPLGGTDNKILQDLINDLRKIADEEGIEANQLPHTALRKWRLGVGTGVAVAAGIAAPVLYTQTTGEGAYHGTGALIGLAGAGAGLSISSLILYLADEPDETTAIIANTLASAAGAGIGLGLYYGLVGVRIDETTQNPEDPEERGEIDIVGQNKQEGASLKQKQSPDRPPRFMLNIGGDFTNGVTTVFPTITPE